MVKSFINAFNYIKNELTLQPVKALSMALTILALSNAPPTFAQGRCESVFLLPAANVDLFVIDLQTLTTPQKMLKHAVANFIAKGRYDDVRVILLKIAEGVRPSADEVALLKASRKYAAILRSTLQVSSKKHQAPEDFEIFVREFGLLNDYIALGKRPETQEVANKLLLANFSLEKLKGTEPASSDSVRHYLKDLRSEVRHLLGKEKISLKEFHDVRKILKDFLNIYYLGSELSGGALYAKEYKYLYDLNEVLGSFNDGLTAAILNGTSNKSDKILYPPEMREAIEYFLEHSKIPQHANPLEEMSP